MSIITLELDNKLQKSDIIVPLKSSTVNEAGDNYVDSGLSDKHQTQVFGIQMPLIMINNTVIDFDAVQYFSLKSVGALPELTMTVIDRYEIINNIDKPGNDNEVRVQILPRFDNAYKKIDLTFYITNISVNGKLIRMSCMYKLPILTASQYKAFGKIDTYTLFKNVAMETGLGFATNIGELDDYRYIYCDNKSLLDTLTTEIEYSNTDSHIMDWWIDLWDNINLADIKERYYAIDSDDDLQIWVASQVNELDSDVGVVPQQTTATLTNFPGLSMSELFFKSYNIQNTPGIQISKGTDNVVSVYLSNKNEYSDFLLQDGDAKQDLFTKYVYLGENYGEYNYMLSKQLRNNFLQKNLTETIVVKLQSPLLGLMRGHKVNIVRYINDSIIEDKLQIMEDAGVVDRNVESNIPLNNFELDATNNGKFSIDKTASGQYLIQSVDVTYINGTWEYTLGLIKPIQSNVSILKKQ